MITVPMRDVLIEHLDGVVIVLAVAKPGEGPALGRRRQTVAALLARELLRYVRFAGNGAKYTVITDAGRRALAEALADWADAEARARYLLPPQESPDRAWTPAARISI